MLGFEVLSQVWGIDWVSESGKMRGNIITHPEIWMDQ